VVLTNSDYFNGWQFEGVPVIGELTRKAICEGKMVEYFDASNGQEIRTHHFVKKEDLTTEIILSLLRDSAELDIAAEGADIEHSVEPVGGIIFLRPDFAIRKETREPFPYEPKQ
jgi:hypothetical protein